jgi:hypothetical protein
MKKLNLVLGMLALALAVAFAAAPSLQETQQSVIDGYEFIPGSGGTEDMCKLWEDACDTDGTVACSVSGANSVLRETDTPEVDQCGQELKRF